MSRASATRTMQAPWVKGRPPARPPLPQHHFRFPVGYIFIFIHTHPHVIMIIKLLESYHGEHEYLKTSIVSLRTRFYRLAATGLLTVNLRKSEIFLRRISVQPPHPGLGIDRYGLTGFSFSFCKSKNPFGNIFWS